MHVICNIVQNGQFYHPFENKDTILRVKVVSDLAYEFCSRVEILVNKILAKTEHLVQ